MATYESLIKIKGAVGDLVFYNLNGKNIVRKKSGFNKTAFKKSPTYEKVRQNSSEFGHCSKIGKAIRMALEKFIKESGDPLLYQKFARLMTEIKDLDTISERGKRTVKNGLVTEKGKSLLKDFQFGDKPNLNDKVSMTSNLLDHTIHLNKDFVADEIVVTSLRIDFENYSAEYFEENILVNQQTAVVFQKYFSDEDVILHFIALKKSGEITGMGFI